jgi:integrase
MSAPVLKYRRGEGLIQLDRQRAPGTINKYLSVLGTMYKLLKTHRQIPRAFQAPSFKGLRLPEDNSRTVQVTLEDVRRLVDAARLTKNRKLPALVAVACTTGLRKGSLLGLTWGDVDLAKRTLDVARTKNGTPVRSVLPHWACAELARIKPTAADKSSPVFGPTEFKRAFGKAIELAGLPSDWTFHSCRHIAASILAQSGASLPVIMQALNHKTPSMALRYSLRCPRGFVASSSRVRSTRRGDRTDEEALHRRTDHWLPA